MKTDTLVTIRIPDFEASLRKAENDALRHAPVVVSTSLKPLGRVVSLCDQARRHGVEAGMHVSAARKVCPEAVFFVTDRHLNEQFQRRILNRALAYTPLVEPAGYDRVVLDTRGTEKLWGPSRAAAALVQKDIRDGLHLPASAGVAVERPWSLLASRLVGDNEVCHVPPGDEDAFLARVPVGWVDGISAKTRARLLELNIRNIGQLRQFNREDLRRQFGPACGDALWSAVSPDEWDTVSAMESRRAAQGDREVRAEAYMGEALVAGEVLEGVLGSLVDRVAESLRARSMGAARIKVALLYADGVTNAAEGKMGGYVQDAGLFMTVAERLWRRIFTRRVRVARIVVEVWKLAPPERQGTLFPTEEDKHIDQLGQILSTVRNRFGDNSLELARRLG
ncbi:MAG: hypothetical protein LIQ30_12260 [Planctomycetes bacterium]|nr:hypothetical protein [Planctomycetota bacterium]MCD7897136.1 hypothetical protein [Planctomycetaceae bacterium]